MRVGVPRCLSHYYLRPLYRSFLTELGVEWDESRPTSAKDLENLALCPTDEPCISVKVAFAHAKKLLDAGCDALFVPTVVSLSETAYCCPKMMGLPAMLRTGLGLEPWQVVSPVIDMKDGPNKWRDSWARAAWTLGVNDRRAAMNALGRGLSEWRRAAQEAVRLLDRASGHVTAVMGHAYILEDVFARKIPAVAADYGQVVLAEMVSPKDAQEELGTLPDGHKMWTIEGQILGASLHLLRRRLVDRMVFVSAFSCGPASIIENYIGKEAEAFGIPFLSIAVDEHTGEAGLITRMEAFLDSAGKPRERTSTAKAREKASAGKPHKTASTASWPDPQAEQLLQPAVSRPRSRPEAPVGLVSMGNLDVPLDTLLTELGAETVPAPPLTDDIVALGKEVAPEFICYPMVTVIGQIRAHAQRGVEKVVMVQGKGRCRLGWYAQVMQEILTRSGIFVDIVAVDSPFPLRQKGREVLESIRALGGKPGFASIARSLEMAFGKLEIIDMASRKLRWLRAYEDERGAGQRCFDEFMRGIAGTGSLAGMVRAYRRYVSNCRDIRVLDTDPLHVSLIGEIYVVNEPFVNKDVEKTLGSMDRRVLVHRKLDLSGWVNYHLFKTPGAVLDYRRVTRMAEPYLPVAVGGHGQESVGEAVLAKKHGYDGVLHLFPFTCMPEIIAQNVLVKVSADLDLPVLSLMISEQTGVAGLYTRLEAFCDLLDGRRRRKTRDGG
ncbi:MAG: acyl-CoA dehydratase activase-related protein [Bacillota bacterium]